MLQLGSVTRTNIDTMPVLLPCRKINTFHMHDSNANLLASSCTDTTVCVWDVRHFTSGSTSKASKNIKPVSILSHGKSCQAAYWAPDGSGRLCSISFDDTLRVFNPESRTEGTMVQKVCNDQK